MDWLSYEVIDKYMNDLLAVL